MAGTLNYIINYRSGKERKYGTQRMIICEKNTWCFYVGTWLDKKFVVFMMFGWGKSITVGQHVEYIGNRP